MTDRPSAVSAVMMEALRPYQITGAVALAARKKMLLGDEPGLGKSRTALTAAKVARPTPAASRATLTAAPGRAAGARG